MADVSLIAAAERFSREERRDLALAIAFFAGAVAWACVLKGVLGADQSLYGDRLRTLLAMSPALSVVAAMIAWFRFTKRQDELFQAKDGIALRIAVLFAAGFATSTTLMQEVAGRDPLPMLWTVGIFIVGYGFGWLCALQKHQ